MSHLTNLDVTSVLIPVTTLTGDSGGAISPVAGNIDILGGNVLTTVGTPGTITINLDNGTDGQLLVGGGANPAWASLTSTGSTITVTGGANTLNIDIAAPVSVANGGTGATTLTDGGVLVGSGVAAVTALAVGTNGQVLIGSTGADPVFASLASADSSITYTPGAGTLDLSVDAAAAGAVIDFLPDSGTTPIVPDGTGSITVAGGTNIGTVGGLNQITVNLDAAISLATSVTSPLYTVAAGDLVLNMTDDVGGNAVSFTNNSDAEVAYIDSLGAASFTNLDVDNINVNGNTIISTDTNGDITLTPDGSGAVNISYLTQYTLPIAGASGAISDLADGLGSSNQVLTSNGAGAEPTWEDAAGGITWNEETGTSATMAVDNGYIANNAGLVTLTLPDTAALGSIVRVAGKGAGGWKIGQNAGETIHFGSSDTTTGVGGSLASTNRYDAIELVCTTANTDWVVISSVGNITVV